MNNQLDIVTIPFHDWRKIQKEGFRTRDAHFIESFLNAPNINRVVVVNRPTTLIEILLKRQKIKLGKKIFSKGNFSLYKVNSKLFVIDFISMDYLGLLKLKKAWFIRKFGDKKIRSFYLNSLKYLGVENYSLISNNLFSADFCSSLNLAEYIFDAYDNLLLIPLFSNINNEVHNAYLKFARDKSCIWCTNSAANQEFFRKEFNRENVPIILNGVNIGLFKTKYNIPDDMLNIPGIKAGFGGKISHLFDVDLFNYISLKNPQMSFILVGQILDRSVYNKIEVRENVYILGDKPYSEYPAYATNFDLAIIPYITDPNRTYGNAIKAFEFLAAGIPIIGTNGNGLSELSDFIWVANSHEEFSKFLDKRTERNLIDESFFNSMTWTTKTNELLNLFNN